MVSRKVARNRATWKAVFMMPCCCEREEERRVV
jgi:hypothetical protein